MTLEIRNAQCTRHDLPHGGANSAASRRGSRRYSRNLQKRLRPEAVGLVPTSHRAHGEREQAEGQGGSAIHAPTPSQPFLIAGRRIHSSASRSRPAAASGVRSRWGEPSISKPTMNFLIVAERRSGG